jgi:hypothetical protein
MCDQGRLAGRAHSDARVSEKCGAIDPWHTSGRVSDSLGAIVDSRNSSDP